MLGERDDAGQPDQSAGGDPKADAHVGRIFGGKYRIEELIAQGGMGRVYRAVQQPIERTVALKILSEEFRRANPQFAPRFFLEAASSAKLAHPHSITVFDYGEADTGELYIAMEYLKGRPLSRILADDGPFPSKRALRIAIQVCRALREAHQLGIVHRDLKPGNIFLLEDSDEGDYAKVLDFGLVKRVPPANAGGSLLDVDSELTHTGSMLGSPKYMSPEQILGGPLDARTDIYSLGVVIFQMIAGRTPFLGATGVEVVYKHVHEAAPRLSEVVPGACPPIVDDLVARMLEKTPDARPRSMDEVLGTLKHALRVAGDAARTGTSDVVLQRPERPTSKMEAALGELGEEPTPVPQASGIRPSPAIAAPSPSPRTVLALSIAAFLVALLVSVYVLRARGGVARDASTAATPPLPPLQPPKPVPDPAQKPTRAEQPPEVRADDELREERPRGTQNAREGLQPDEKRPPRSVKKASTRSLYRQNPY